MASYSIFTVGGEEGEAVRAALPSKKLRLKADAPSRVLPGYDCDVTDEDALLHTIDMRIVHAEKWLRHASPDKVSAEL